MYIFPTWNSINRKIMNMQLMPIEIVILIIKKIDDVDTLLNTKISCQLYKTLVSDFIIKKLILSKKILNYKPLVKLDYLGYPYSMCINIDCWDDTVDIYEDIYNSNNRRYCHSVQDAVNKSTMTINSKIYPVNTPYCCECFTNFVLIGDSKKVKHNYKMDTINIDFL